MRRTFDLFDVTFKQQNRTVFKQFSNFAKKNGDIDGTCKKVQVMTCSHCTGPGTGQGTGNDGFLYEAMYCTHYTGPGLGMMDFCIRLCTVHTTQRQGPGLGTMGFCIRLCTVHTTRG